MLFPVQELCGDPCNEVLIFSGSEMAKLEETFGQLPVWLAAENGVYVRPPKATHLPQVRGGAGGGVLATRVCVGGACSLGPAAAAVSWAKPSQLACSQASG